ncbi:MAG: hypothetical protein H5U02_14175 [Clostridia bacterium]|nr:hypothetical protein [Clostridia bacterium]
MRRWLKWPLLLMVGALWGIAAYKLADLHFYCGLRGVALWLFLTLFVFPYMWVPYLLGLQLHYTLVEYFEPFIAVHAALLGIVNVLIIYLVVVGVRRVLARRRRRREPGA